MNKGEIAWQIANGDTPPEIKNHPLLRGVNLPRTGSQSRAGTLVTKTLLFAGEGYGGQPMFRAYDKKTGQILWETKIPGGSGWARRVSRATVPGRRPAPDLREPLPGLAPAASRRARHTSVQYYTNCSPISFMKVSPSSEPRR